MNLLGLKFLILGFFFWTGKFDEYVLGSLSKVGLRRF